jgi:hypothetical protein
MTEAQLDTIYTALAEAISRVGPGKAELLLATLALDLLSQQGDASSCLKMIVQAEQLAEQ